MNKSDINAVVEMFPLSSDVSKSLTNRLESALGKEGSPSARLRMASSSLLALSDKTADEQESAIIAALGSFLVIASDIAKDNTPAPSTTTPKAPKATREKWFDADSAEAKAITTPKPRTKKTETPAISAELITALLEAISARG
jgi:hypothetical protein